MTEDEKFMEIALKEAIKAKKNNEVPVGAVVVLNGEVVSRAHNKREQLQDATAHAEILAIKKACKKVRDFRLLSAKIYVTLEPCVMCLGAILNARIDTLFYGASINKENAIKSYEIIERAEMNHKCKVFSGVLGEKCGNLVSEYFKDKRKNKKDV